MYKEVPQLGYSQGSSRSLPTSSIVNPDPVEPGSGNNERANKKTNFYFFFAFIVQISSVDCSFKSENSWSILFFYQLSEFRIRISFVLMRIRIQDPKNVHIDPHVNPDPRG